MPNIQLRLQNCPVLGQKLLDYFCRNCCIVLQQFLKFCKSAAVICQKFCKKSFMMTFAKLFLLLWLLLWKTGICGISQQKYFNSRKKCTQNHRCVLPKNCTKNLKCNLCSCNSPLLLPRQHQKVAFYTIKSPSTF